MYQASWVRWRGGGSRIGSAIVGVARSGRSVTGVEGVAGNPVGDVVGVAVISNVGCGDGDAAGWGKGGGGDGRDRVGVDAGKLG